MMHLHLLTLHRLIKELKVEVIYEDNHIIVVSKTCREIVQGDKTGDEPLSETLKRWIKEKYNKPGHQQRCRCFRLW